MVRKELNFLSRNNDDFFKKKLGAPGATATPSAAGARGRGTQCAEQSGENNTLFYKCYIFLKKVAKYKMWEMFMLHCVDLQVEGRGVRPSRGDRGRHDDDHDDLDHHLDHHRPRRQQEEEEEEEEVGHPRVGRDHAHHGLQAIRTGVRIAFKILFFKPRALKYIFPTMLFPSPFLQVRGGLPA